MDKITEYAATILTGTHRSQNTGHPKFVEIAQTSRPIAHDNATQQKLRDYWLSYDASHRCLSPAASCSRKRRVRRPVSAETTRESGPS